MSSQPVLCGIPAGPSGGWLRLEPKRQLLFRQHALLRSESVEPWFNINRTCRRNTSVQQIYHRDRHQCVYCGKDLRDAPDLTIDHLIPQSCFRLRGIANQDANRVTCCLECNRFKSDWIPALGASAWRSRLNLIEAAGREIARRRGKRRVQTIAHTPSESHPNVKLGSQAGRSPALLRRPA